MANAWALTFDGIDDYVSLPNPTVLASSNYELTFEMLWIDETEAHILGIDSNFAPGINIRRNGNFRVRYNNGEFTVSAGLLDLNTLYKFKLVRLGDDHELFLDDASVATATLTSVGTVGCNTICRASTTYPNIRLYYLEYIDNNNALNSRMYKNNLESTASVYPETINDQNGILFGSPVWSLYDDSYQFNINQAPTAEAGTTINVVEGVQFQLNGSGIDTDGTIENFAWTQTAGTTTALSSTSVANPTGTRAITGTGETLTYSLIVTDDDGADSVADTVNVVVSAAVAENQAPTVVTNGNQTNIATGATVTLSATGSSDSDGTIATRLWEQISGTPTVTLTNSTSAVATYTAPDLSSNANLTFRITLTDNDGATSTATVTHQINANETVIDLDLATAPLVTSLNLDYIGAFHGTGAFSSTGVFCISEDGNSFFTFKGFSFIEVEMPNSLARESGYRDTEACAEIQNSGELLFDNGGQPYTYTNRINLGISGYFRPVGMLHKNGKLIVNYLNWYDATGTTNVTTFVFRDANDLANCVIDGPFGMDGQTRQAGCLNHTPPNLVNFFGGDILSGAPSESIVSRSDYGPSVRAFNFSELLEQNVSPENYIQFGGQSYIRYEFDNVSGTRAQEYKGFIDRVDYAEFLNQPSVCYASSSNNAPLQKADGSFTNTNFFNQTSRLVGSFVIPNSKTLCSIVALRGSTAEPYYTEASVLPTGVTNGIGYKVQTWFYNYETNQYQLTTSDSPGGAQYILDDAVHRFYLFDLSDLQDVKDGNLEPWEVQPYYYEDFKCALQFDKTNTVATHLIPRHAQFDYNTNILYFAYQSAGGVGAFDYSAAITAIDLNGLADRSSITDGTAPANRSPTLQVVVNSLTVSAGDTITFTANASDIDNDTLTYLWSSGETTSSITVTAPIDDIASTVTRSCIVNDGVLDSPSRSVTVNVNAVVVAPDTSVPTLSAVPATTTYNLTNGATFTMPVISRTDNGTTETVTPVITLSGQVVANVDTSVNGTYTITANYSDDAGNAATPLVITVNVAVTQTTSTAQVTITGITNGTHAIKLWNDATNAILFNGNLTFTDTTATTSLDVAAGTVFVGRWIGDNPPTTGTGIYGVTV